MKMLGFMIALTLAYWVMASYAQSLVRVAEPCPAAIDIAASPSYEASAAEAAPQTLVRPRARWSETDPFDTTETAAPACTS